jgi:tRNA threonylcarbamoyladenosine biosynthesis protein TsaE
VEFEINNKSDLGKIIKLIQEKRFNIIILSGTLGSGKTTFVQEFAKNIGIKDEVLSPTFSIQNIYDDKIYHYDLYNKDINDFLSLGMLEELQKDGYHFVEWGEGLEYYLKQFGLKYLKIEIILLDNKRIFKCIL